MAEDRFIRSERHELRAERGVAQYQRLASLLRHRIAKGEYPLGAQLPADHAIGRRPGCRRRHGPAGVRTAVQGRAHPQPARCRDACGRTARCRGRPRAGDQRSVRRAAGARLRDPRSAPPHRLPQELLGADDKPADENVCVRKLHTYSGEPFCYAEIYVPTPVFEALPRTPPGRGNCLPRCSMTSARAADEFGNA